MQRILVIGCPGAGKSTFSRSLQGRLGLPLFYLDRLWHRADRTTVSREEFDRGLAGILAGEQWIIDGNYLRTLKTRLERCDTVFLLDYPVALCLESAQARIGKKREDMPWVENEFDEEFRQWIIDFPEKQLPRVYELLQAYQAEKQIFIFKSRQEADAYLNEEGNI